jgi:hypothetical protein
MANGISHVKTSGGGDDLPGASCGPNLPPMYLTDRQLNRATLERQLLLRRASLEVEPAVAHLFALQAQSPPSPYLALWNRLAGFAPADLDAAYAAGRVVKATLLRITLHAVQTDDHAVLRAAMLPALRASRLGDRRFTDSGLTADEVDGLEPHVLAFAADEGRTRAEVEAHLTEHLGDPPHERAWWALRTYAALRHAPTGGPWAFGATPAYLAADAHGDLDHASAIREVIRRYLAAFGPARIQDLVQFTLLRQRQVVPVLDAMGDELEQHTAETGHTLVDLAGAAPAADDGPAPPRLLPMWDSVLLAYADRSRVLPDAYRPLVIRRNGDVLASVLVDGRVRGVWRTVDDEVEVTAFEPLGEATWEELAAEATALRELLADRDTAPYGRYDHWWAKLPDGERRILTGGPV